MKLQKRCNLIKNVTLLIIYLLALQGPLSSYHISQSFSWPVSLLQRISKLGNCVVLSVKMSQDESLLLKINQDESKISRKKSRLVRITQIETISETSYKTIFWTLDKFKVKCITRSLGCYMTLLAPADGWVLEPLYQITLVEFFFLHHINFYFYHSNYFIFF